MLNLYRILEMLWRDTKNGLRYFAYSEVVEHLGFLLIICPKHLEEWGRVGQEVSAFVILHVRHFVRLCQPYQLCLHIKEKSYLVKWIKIMGNGLWLPFSCRMLDFQQQATDVTWEMNCPTVYLSILQLMTVELYPDGDCTRNILDLLDLCPLGYWRAEWLGHRAHIASTWWDNAKSCFQGVVPVYNSSHLPPPVCGSSRFLQINASTEYHVLFVNLRACFFWYDIIAYTFPHMITNSKYKFAIYVQYLCLIIYIISPLIFLDNYFINNPLDFLKKLFRMIKHLWWTIVAYKLFPYCINGVSFYSRIVWSQFTSKKKQGR